MENLLSSVANQNVSFRLLNFDFIAMEFSKSSKFDQTNFWT